MRHIICQVVLLSALSAFGQGTCPKVFDPPSDTPTVLFTARLLGYLWHERAGTQEPVTNLLKANIECSREQYRASVLLGMGDNLAPEYESRFDKDGNRKARVPKGGVFDFNNDSTVKAFPYLGYDAMVPGLEDFYFGPEYLRQLGDHWNNEHAKDPTKAPKLLASNLVIQTSSVPPKQYDVEEQNYVTQQTDVSVAIPDSVLPWAQSITVFVATKTAPGWMAQLCTATNSPVDIDSSPSGCADLVTTVPVRTSGDVGYYRFQLPAASNPIHLEAGRSYGFCITGLPPDSTESAGKRFCKPFHVARPFFAGRQPWLERDRNGTRFVVFGVVDDELRGALTPENAAWRDDDKQHSEVAVIPPDLAIAQSVEAYMASNPVPPSGRVVRVLLAQMAPAKAEALAATLNSKMQSSQDASAEFEFDLVLTAADFRRSTGNESREIQASTVQGTISAPLIIPHPIYLPGSDQSKVGPALVDPLEAVFIKFNTNSRTYVSEPSMPARQNQQDDFKKACSLSPDLYEDVKAILARHPEAASEYQCAGTNMDALKCFTLDAVRKEFNSDIAMLQQWNFFNGCLYRPQGPISQPIDSAELLESLRRTVWSASYVTRVNLTGAKLKTVLDTSAKIAAAQKSSTYTSLLHDRDLVYIGVSKKDKTYYVNGQPIDDTRIYSIATDDTLAVGNSEYPDMLDSSFAAPEVFRDNEARDTLSSVCLELASFPEYQSVRGNCPDGIAKDLIMASAEDWGGQDNRTPLGYRQEFHDYVKSLLPSESPLPAHAAAETNVQNRRILSLTLQNLAGSFAYSKPNRTDLGVQEEFGGVTNNNVIQAHTEKYSLQDAVRLISSGAHFNFGVDEETQFGRSRQGSLSGGPDSVTLTSNVLLVSPFVEYNLHRWTPRWKLILRPIDYLSDLAGTKFSLDSASPSTQFTVQVPPRNNLQTRFGARFERDTTGTSFFEFGYIHRDARNVLSSVTFNPGTPTQFFCPLNVPQSAGTCASQVILVTKTTVPTFGSFQQNGMYWNSMFTIPLLTKLSYVFATDGNLFSSNPGHDVSPLTRYAVSIDSSIKFPILGNLAFAPHYGIFLFEDQVQHATLTRTVADVQLTYYFDWHQGLRWWNVFKGKAAQPPAPTAGLSASGFSSTPNILK